MQIDTQAFIELCKETGKLYTWDIEATGLNCDYNSIVVVSVKPYGQVPRTFVVNQPGDDKALVAEVRDFLATGAMWATFYGKMFDVKMMEGRLLKWGLPAMPKKHHLDLFFQLVGKVNTSRKSQAHLARWLELPEKKMDIEPDIWNRIFYDPAAMALLVERCESDVTTLEQGVIRCQHLCGELTR